MADDDSHRSKRGGVDSISSLPDEILQHILSFTPAESAARTSLLSKRWRHVWCCTPSLSFDGRIPPINRVQNLYTAPKMMSFHLRGVVHHMSNVPNINLWINLASSRNVENMSLDLKFNVSRKYKQYFFREEFFQRSSSLKNLSIKFDYMDIRMPTICHVSWTSLRTLSVCSSALSDDSVAEILSGCPVLESLTLSFCHELRVLDLTESRSIKTLEVNREFRVSEPLEIVAPHINRLRLINSRAPCTLVDVSSLAEAELDFCFEECNISSFQRSILEDDDTRDVMAIKSLEMLEKLQKVEKLTYGGHFLQVLSLAELRGLSFPMLEVKILTLEASPFELDLQGTNDGIHSDESRWSTETNHVGSFMERMLKNSKTIDKMIVQLEDRYLEARGFKEMVKTLSQNNNNVSIVCSTKPKTFDQ